jgi:hypothetical protein
MNANASSQPTDRRSGRWMTTLEQRLKLAYNTVMRAIGQLQDQGILTAATAAKRGRLFCAQSLLDILEEPARLTPSRPLPATSLPTASPAHDRL